MDTGCSSTYVKHLYKITMENQSNTIYKNGFTLYIVSERLYYADVRNYNRKYAMYVRETGVMIRGS